MSPLKTALLLAAVATLTLASSCKKEAVPPPEPNVPTSEAAIKAALVGRWEPSISFGTGTGLEFLSSDTAHKWNVSSGGSWNYSFSAMNYYIKGDSLLSHKSGSHLGGLYNTGRAKIVKLNSDNLVLSKATGAGTTNQYTYKKRN